MIFRAAIESCGFQFEGCSGSHHIYRHPGPPPQMLSVQPKKDGKAKPYQVEQFRQALEALEMIP
jgi:predicted RNA binding protein YcfA (HicA-like mRNA interferase family)